MTSNTTTRAGARGPWIQTYTGVAFDLLDPSPDMVELEDIAHSLSLLCRYTGHSSRFYSVAEHSLEVARLAAKCSPEQRAIPMARWGLMHDAAEAYVGDMSAPLKSVLPKYKRIEREISGAVISRFGIDLGDGTIQKVIKHFDRVMLVTEAKALMGPAPKDWGIGVEPLVGWEPRCLSPKEAKAEFLSMATELFAGAL